MYLYLGKMDDTPFIGTRNRTDDAYSNVRAISTASSSIACFDREIFNKYIFRKSYKMCVYNA